MMSLPIWLSGPMFLLGRGVSVQGDLYRGEGSLSREFLSWGVSIRRTPHLYGEEQVICILLECFLVENDYT